MRRWWPRRGAAGRERLLDSLFSCYKVLGLFLLFTAVVFSSGSQT